MLDSAVAHYRQQQRYAAVGVAAARRAWGLRNPALVAGTLAYLQSLAARDGAASVAEMLDEQGIDAEPIGEVNTEQLAGVASDGRPLGTLTGQARSLPALETIVLTQISDASRVAAGVGVAARPKVGWTRMVTPPSCPRCAVLAGKFFRWNQGFQRHPRCDCRHIPTTEDRVGDVRTNPRALFEQGQVRGVTAAEQKAIAAGGDVGQVVNARRSLYVDEAGRPMTREPLVHRGSVRITPEQIYREAAGSHAEALRLLERFGYIL